MAFIPTVNAVRTDVQCVSANQQIHNVLWFIQNTTWQQADREALNTALVAWWTTYMKPIYPGTVALAQLTTVNQENQSAPSSTLVVSPMISGTAGGAASANSSCSVATLRTSLRGRAYRGRLYLGPLPNAQLTDSITFSLGQATLVITAMNALISAVTTLGATWVVVSKQFNKIKRSVGWAEPVTAVSVDQYVDSQRRRLGGRGV